VSRIGINKDAADQNQRHQKQRRKQEPVVPAIKVASLFHGDRSLGAFQANRCGAAQFLNTLPLEHIESQRQNRAEPGGMGAVVGIMVAGLGVE
jgi:hypothetical protein